SVEDERVVFGRATPCDVVAKSTRQAPIYRALLTRMPPGPGSWPLCFGFRNRGSNCLRRDLIIGYACPIDGDSAVDRRGPGHVRGHAFSAPQGTIAVRAKTAVTLPGAAGHSPSVCLPDFPRRDWPIADALENPGFQRVRGSPFHAALQSRARQSS